MQTGDSDLYDVVREAAEEARFEEFKKLLGGSEIKPRLQALYKKIQGQIASFTIDAARAEKAMEGDELAKFRRKAKRSLDRLEGRWDRAVRDVQNVLDGDGDDGGADFGTDATSGEWDAVFDLLFG